MPGYEAGARAGEAIIPESYFYWHTTGTAGIFGSAAASASILGLDAQQTNMCLGSAGTQAAGLWEFLKEGAMSKALHAGRAASAGVFSAYLAQSGFTAASKFWRVKRLLPGSFRSAENRKNYAEPFLRRLKNPAQFL